MMQTHPSLLRLLTLTLLCFLLLEGFLRLPPVENHLERIMFNEIAHKNKLLFYQPKIKQYPPDILAFGTSRTRFGFNPEVFDKTLQLSETSFNLGASSASPLLHRFWLEQYIYHYGKPKLVLLEVPEFVFNKHYADSETLHYLRSTAQEHPIRFIRTVITAPYPWDKKRDILLTTFWDMYRYREFLKLSKCFKTLFADPHKRYQWRYAPNGWLAKNEAFNTETSQKQLKTFQEKALKSYEPDVTSARHFLAYARSQGIPVILVQWPVSQAFYNLDQEQHVYTPYLNSIRQLQIEFHVPFVNLNDTVPDAHQTRYFADAHHLNTSGASVMSDALAKAVRPYYTLLITQSQ